MKIQLIELENYRQYRGKVSIELCCDSTRNFTVFQGVNGSGKTNMLNAVEWCLYNREDHLSKYASKRQPIINDAELRELVKGQKIYARVTLKMIDEKDNNRFYQFDRRIGARRLDNGRVEFDGQSEFHCYMQIGKDIKEIGETEILINRILPHGVKSFFFFDGEQLDDFFKEEKSAEVRDAIFDVSQLDLLDRTIEHLEKTISSIRGEVKGESPKVDEITEKIKEVEKGLENSKQMKKEKEDKLKEIRSKLKDIEDKLGDSNESIVKALQSQREKLENRLEQIEGSIEENKERAINNLIEVGPFICGFDALKNALRQIEGKVVKGDIPPKIKQTFVSELLQKGECICGTDVTTNNKARQKLEELLNGVKISEIYEEIIQLKFQLNPMMSKVEEFIEKQDTIRKKIKNLEEEKEKIKTELQEVSTKLQGINVEEITNLEITRGKLKQELESLSRDIGVFDEKIKNARLFLEKCQRDFAYIPYNTVNRRVRALEEHGYIEKSGERKTKTGFVAKLYQLTARAYLAVLLDRTNLHDFIEKAPDDRILSALAAFLYILMFKSNLHIILLVNFSAHIQDNFLRITCKEMVNEQCRLQDRQCSGTFNPRRRDKT